MNWHKTVIGLALMLTGIASPLSHADRSVVFRHHTIDQSQTNRIVVKWRSEGVAAVQMQHVQERALRLSDATGIRMNASRNLYGRTDVMLLNYTPSHDDMLRIIARLNADPAVEYAEPDGWRYLQDFPATAPNDPHFVASTDPSNDGRPDLNFGSWVGQWYLLDSSTTTPSAISAVDAWKSASALGSGIVVAIIDSGVLATHLDLAGQLQAPGFDFVSCDEGNFSSTVTTALGATQALDECTASGSAATYDFANDNNQNWHADGTDPGDFIDNTDVTLPLFKNNGCTTVTNSTWHGTKVAGVIGAIANNHIGIVGVAPSATLLSVRVVGKCAARATDLAAAILWAAGQPVTVSAGSIAASPAARIINISLGANSPCSNTEQDAINSAMAAGVLVVAAAGNEGGPLDAPANCKGVVSVVGLRHTGDKVPFSSLSSATTAATIAAPGGNCVNINDDINKPTKPCLYDIETTSDASQTAPSATPDFYTYSLLNLSYLNSGGSIENNGQVGTSFATPMVSGVAALMLSVNSKLTPGQLTARLQSSARAFPTSSAGSSPNPPTCTVAASSADSQGNFTEPKSPAECLCTTSTCGAGMLDAAAAVIAAGAAFVQITPSKTSASPGEKVTLNGSGSTASSNATIVSYQWSTDPAVSGILTNADQAVATLIVPSFRSIKVTLTITDSNHVTSTASVEIESSIGAKIGRKGGALTPCWIMALGLLALWQLHRRRAALSVSPF